MITRSLLLFIATFYFVIPVQAGQWSDQFAGLGFDNNVMDIQVIDSEIIACGLFTANGNIPTPALATWTGSGWEPLATYPPFREPSHIAHIDGMIVTNGFNTSWIPDGPYRWTGDQWEVMGSGLETGYVNRIQCSTTYQGMTVVGGFSQPPVAWWDGADWSFNMPDNIIGIVNAMAVYEGDLYVAGSLFKSDWPGSDGLMRWDGEQWDIVSALDPETMTPQAGLDQTDDYYGYATSLVVHDGLLYIGGQFDQVGTMAVSKIVALDATTGQWVQVPELSAAPNALASFDGKVYAGGPNGTIPVASGPGSLGSLSNGVWTEAGQSPHGTVDVLTAHDELLIGGTFDQAGGVPAGNFTTWNGASYHDLLNSGGIGLNGLVEDLAPYESTMLAAGEFTLAGDLSVSGLAQWNNPGWSSFSGGGPNGPVRQLLVDGSDLYLVGEFTSVNGLAMAQVAHYDGLAWSGFDAELPSPPTGVALFEGDLFVSSDNSYRNEENSLMRGYFARWIGGDWDLIIDDANIYDLTVYDGSIWMALANVEFEGVYPNIVAYDGLNLSGVFAYPEVNGARNLSVVGNELFILGDFGDMWTWDGVQLQVNEPSSIQLPDNTSGLGLGQVYDIFDAGDRFYLATGGDYNGYTAWEWIKDSDSARPLDRGTNGSVNAICQQGQSVFFGGWFSMAGLTPALNFNPMGNPIPSPGIARWMPNLSPANHLPPSVAGFSLHNVPNPFNPNTTISYDLPEPVAELEITIYDTRGRLVRSYRLGSQESGQGAVVWEGKNQSGQSVASGVYLYQLQADQKVATRTMTLVK